MAGVLVYEGGMHQIKGDDPVRPISGLLSIADLDASGNLAGATVTVGGLAALDSSTSFGGDVSGAYDSIEVLQVDCPNSENWPSVNSKIAFAVNEIGDTLFFNVQYSDGTQKSGSVALGGM